MHCSASPAVAASRSSLASRDAASSRGASVELVEDAGAGEPACTKRNRRARRAPRRASFERASELASVLRSEHGRWVMIEVQGDEDEDKARRWTLVSAALLDQTGDGRCRRDHVLPAGRALGSPRGAPESPLGTESVLRPVVLVLAGEIVDALLDEAHPELALLATWAMHRRHGPAAQDVVRRALELTEALPEPLRLGQQRAIYTVLSKRMRAFLKETGMDLDKIPEPPDAREARLAMRKVLDRARAEGEASGEARGEARGKARGQADALLTMLEARGLKVSDEQRARVLACVDLPTLEAWIRRATTAATVDEALG